MEVADAIEYAEGSPLPGPGRWRKESTRHDHRSCDAARRRATLALLTAIRRQNLPANSPTSRPSSEALREEMRRDPNVLLMGEDIAGGFRRRFKVTKGFEAEIWPAAG